MRISANGAPADTILKRASMTFWGGRWRDSGGRSRIPVLNPATESILAESVESSPEQVGAAVHAAAAARGVWNGSSPSQRAELLSGIADALEERAEELALLVTDEVGTPIAESRRMQLPTAVHTFRSTAAAIEDFGFREMLDTSVIEHCPIGVVAAITPWNYPLYLAACKLAPAIAAGCPIVLKPSETAPLAVTALVDLCHGAGVPGGALGLVQGSGETVGKALVAAAGVDMISFTGSTRTGARIAAQAGRLVRPVALELGGKSAAVVLDEALLESAVRQTVAKCFQNAGQTCAALSRLLVPRHLKARTEELAAAFAGEYATGDPRDPQTTLGPLASEAQLRRVRGFVRRADKDGARVLCGGWDLPVGVAKGYFARATVISDVSPEMEVAREEIFGPVLSILAFEDEKQALAIANGTEFGLSGAVWAADAGIAMRFARRMRAGSVSINGAPTNADAPFGGFGASGFGRERGRAGIEEYLATRAIHSVANG
ncbi:MAG: aldehyde dehydrogenase family protein [Gammaproteobacteria bacterium]|nr:aldehyde dehydrogenase family protein [Chromatiales bacterium]MYE49174.1 aldehyde dehydrogenase family protein [Gammaproteobacteria bacterium]